MSGQLCRLFRLPKPWTASKQQLSHSVNDSMTPNQVFRSVRNVPSDSTTSDESAIVEHIARLLVEFQLANTDAVPPGWVVRVLARCSIPYVEIWDVFHQMYESHVGDIGTGSSTRVRFSLFFTRFPRSAHRRLFKYSQLQSAYFSRIG